MCNWRKEKMISIKPVPVTEIKNLPSFSIELHNEFGELFIRRLRILIKRNVVSALYRPNQQSKAIKISLLIEKEE